MSRGGAAATPDPQGLDSLFAPAARRGPTRSQVGGSGSQARTGGAPPGEPRPSRANVVGGTALPKALSERYMELDRLECGDRVLDGFVDLAADGIVVDRSQDETLAVVITKAQQKLQKASDPVTALMALGLFVSEVCGRSGQHAMDLADRAKRRLEEHRGLDGHVLLGSLFGDQGKKKKVLGAGLSRHRALTFKILADSVGSLECTLQRDKARMTAWNTVQLNQVGYVVDLMHEPGALYEAGSQKQQEYVRLLEPGFSKLQNTLSTQQTLGGKVPRPPWHVEPADLIYKRDDKSRLGKGGFGEVFRGTWADSVVAIKVVTAGSPTDYDVLDFILEIALLSKLSHPNVMRFWRGCAEVSNGKRSLLMVTENIDKGGLSGILHGHGGPRFHADFSLPQVLVLVSGIARGMQYLHSCNVLHLDLKSPNVLVDSSWTLKLCDFGLAKISMQQVGDGFQTTLRGVSPIWAPPEMFDDRADNMTDKADVYSFGIVFFETATRQLPFQEISQRQLPKAKFEGILPRIPLGVEDDCGALVKACCAHRPGSRPSMSGVLARIMEMATARYLDLSEVAMPPWRDGDAKEMEREQKVVRELGGRKKKLQAECKQLLQQMEQTREQRRKLQEQHLGVGVAEEAAIPLVSSSARSVSPREKAKGKAPSGKAPGKAPSVGSALAVAAGVPTVPQVDKKQCCTAQ